MICCHLHLYQSRRILTWLLGQWFSFDVKLGYSKADINSVCHLKLSLADKLLPIIPQKIGQEGEEDAVSGVSRRGALGARAPSSGDRKRHTDSGFSLALVQRMLLILLVAPVTTASQSNEATLPLLMSKPIYEAPWVTVASIT